MAEAVVRYGTGGAAARAVGLGIGGYAALVLASLPFRASEPELLAAVAGWTAAVVLILAVWAAATGLVPLPAGRDWVPGEMGWGAVTWFALAGLTLVAAAIGVRPAGGPQVEAGVVWTWSFAASVFLVAAVQEVLLRGVVLFGLLRLARPFVAVLLTSSIYALAHVGHGAPGVVYFGLAGMLLGGVAAWRQGFVAPLVTMLMWSAQPYVLIILVSGR